MQLRGAAEDIVINLRRSSVDVKRIPTFPCHLLPVLPATHERHSSNTPQRTQKHPYVPGFFVVEHP